jgi:hypothetical protein
MEALPEFRVTPITFASVLAVLTRRPGGPVVGALLDCGRSEGIDRVPRGVREAWRHFRIEDPRVVGAEYGIERRSAIGALLHFGVVESPEHEIPIDRVDEAAEAVATDGLVKDDAGV